VLLALHLPGLGASPAVGGDWRTNRTADRDDGARVRCLARITRYDEDERVFETTLRYQLLRGDRLDHQEDRVFLLHWHTQAGFRGLLEEAGFEEARAVRGDWTPSKPDDPAFVFVARRPGAT